ncbi:hypothetical protein NHX12_025100 [Muraenolepis orangiensis]|uniref:G-protein coupled receptors family 1 profile domain-containing protein n=1 Tax=Muraenolepis orangiensis TaxID=630683 RepID=A0A9Q0IRY0_9TELE|nr:hypothetical protein NHX12_025100 [Muraenolepis orangiensis]
MLAMDSTPLNATLPAFNRSLVFQCGEMMEGIMTWAFFSVLVLLLGSLASVCVLWDLVDKHYRGRQPMTSNSWFTLNVTLMDVVFLAFLLPEVLNVLLWQSEEYQRFAYLVYSLNYSGRPLFAACVCLDCYMAVLHPLRYRSQSLRTRALITAGVWLATLAHGSAILAEPGLLTEPLMSWPFFCSLVVILYCDGRLLWALGRPGTSRGGEPHPQKKRALRIVAVSLVIALGNYLFTLLATTLGRLLVPDERRYVCLVVFLATIPVELTTVLMPGLYLRGTGRLCCLPPTCCNHQL